MRSLGPKTPRSPAGRTRDSFTIDNFDHGTRAGQLTSNGYWMTRRVIDADAWLPEFPDLVAAAQADPLSYCYSAGEYPDPFEPGRTYGKGQSMRAIWTDWRDPSDPLYQEPSDELVWLCMVTHAAGAWVSGGEMPDHHPNYSVPSDLWMADGPWFSGGTYHDLKYTVIPSDEYLERRANGFQTNSLGEMVGLPAGSSGLPWYENLTGGYYSFGTVPFVFAGHLGFPVDAVSKNWILSPAVKVWSVPYVRDVMWVPPAG